MNSNKKEIRSKLVGSVKATMVASLLIFSVGANAGLGNDGIKCLKGGAWYDAQWEIHEDDRLVGGNQVLPNAHAFEGLGSTYFASVHDSVEKFKARVKTNITVQKGDIFVYESDLWVSGVWGGPGATVQREFANIGLNHTTPHIGGCNPAQNTFGTLDCLEHDYCLITESKNGNAGANDRGCGKEWGDAADDMTLLTLPFGLLICAIMW